MRRTLAILGGVTLVLILLGPANAATTVIQPGPADGKDTWIWDQEDSSHADSGELRANDTSEHSQYILIQFDLSGIPGGATVNSATLGLYRYDGYNDDGLTLDARKITSSWAETVTWSGQPTFSGTVESSTTVYGDGWSTWDLTALAQSWVNGADNFGVAVYDHGSSFFQRFVSSDNSVATQPDWALPPTDASLRPYLMVTYNGGGAVPEPVTMFSAFLAISSLGMYIRKRIKGQAAA